jgi:hypothetical protein
LTCGESEDSIVADPVLETGTGRIRYDSPSAHFPCRRAFLFGCLPAYLQVLADAAIFFNNVGICD